MKKLFFLSIIAAFVFAACKPDPDFSPDILSSKTNDLGCDINLPQSAIHVIGLSLDEAASFLLEKGWQETGDKLNNERRTFICKDSSQVLHTYYLPGPRTSLEISVADGLVNSSHINCYCYPSENPFHHLANWDAWINQDQKSIDHWEANFGLKSSGFNKHYSSFLFGGHKKFYSDLEATKEEDIATLSFTYINKMHINVGAFLRSGLDPNPSTDKNSYVLMVNIGMTVDLYNETW